MVKELKKELSKLSGVDFFNPKYRDVFKKYFPDDTTEAEVNNAEEEVKESMNEVVADEVATEQVEDIANEEVTEDEKSEEVAEDVAEQTEEIAHEKEQNDETMETKSEAEASTEDVETKEPEQKAEDVKDTSKELLETKVELELVKAGVREDRLESAKKLFMSEISSLNDLDKLKELIKQYPEWIKKDKSNAKPFGMPLTDMGDGLTEEEKRLKELGIDPKA